MLFNADVFLCTSPTIGFISEFLWLCRVAALKSLPVHPFNALIFPILRDCLQSVCIFLSLKLIGINDFSFQFRKIITRYRRIAYNLNVMRQSACLVFNPIMVDNYAAFFNCTPVDRASDSMIAPT